MKREQVVVLCLFGGLIVVCSLLVVLGNVLGAYSGTTLVDVGSEGLRATISALVGALSMLIGAKTDEKK